jgi:hypothetical protein
VLWSCFYRGVILRCRGVTRGHREPGFDMVIISNCLKNVRKTTARTRRGTLIYTGHSQKTKEE